VCPRGGYPPNQLLMAVYIFACAALKPNPRRLGGQVLKTRYPGWSRPLGTRDKGPGPFWVVVCCMECKVIGANYRFPACPLAACSDGSPDGQALHGGNEPMPYHPGFTACDQITRVGCWPGSADPLKQVAQAVARPGAAHRQAQRVVLAPTPPPHPPTHPTPGDRPPSAAARTASLRVYSSRAFWPHSL
jgi:hypothetical protein